MSKYKFRVKKFNELSINELYEIVKSRSEVFVCEQQVTCENDFDDRDKECIHLFAVDNKEGKENIVAYCRLLPPGLAYEEASIGRVLVMKEYRKQGIGEEMMREAIDVIKENFKADKITLSAQSYIKKMYESVGFKQVSEEYEEAEIPHVKMKFWI